ncbi:hypothetical protein RN001_008309 [Aquatica leii]|uniref:DEUBAD domain-containing protein n=1 Tax=Aquatica leii TaxID=1421715 RepID=A0AAN7PAK5_9COLE|nr:hypothetical protein RN001_008309 [Aquatica leii]
MEQNCTGHNLGNLTVTDDVSINKTSSQDDALRCCVKLNNMENPSGSSIEKKDHNKHHNNKKVIKHALRQQAKRRRKNTTIAAGNSASIPRIVVKPLPPQPTEEIIQLVPPIKTHTTMREVLASIPGFNIKPRKRTNKKLSTAAQLEQTKEGCIDLETPDSILVNTNLRSLLNKYTFAVLPSLYQHKLVQLLPAVDRPPVSSSTDVATRLSASGLNNEFFARACLEWQERLAEGEFTPENQQKLKIEADKERSRLDPWKLKHFEPIWGDRSNGGNAVAVKEPSPPPRPPIKTTIKLRPTTSISNKNKPASFIKRIRTVGAVTRSCTNYKVELEASNQLETITRSPIPDLLPIKTHKSHINKTKDSNSAFNRLIPNDTQSVEIIKETESEEYHETQTPIINISDTIMQTNEETIISCRENNNKVDKRRRSMSLEDEEIPPKKLSLSPAVENVCDSQVCEEQTEINASDAVDTVKKLDEALEPEVVENNTEDVQKDDEDIFSAPLPVSIPYLKDKEETNVIVTELSDVVEPIPEKDQILKEKEDSQTVLGSTELVEQEEAKHVEISIQNSLELTRPIEQEETQEHAKNEEPEEDEEEEEEEDDEEEEEEDMQSEESVINSSDNLKLPEALPELSKVETQPESEIEQEPEVG